MKAKIEVLAGQVRIFDDPRNQLRGLKVEPVAAPYSVELDDEWAVGSASSIGEPKSGSFSITTLEDGELRTYDAGGTVATRKVTAGATISFETIEANAYTVSAVQERQPKRRKG